MGISIEWNLFEFPFSTKGNVYSPHIIKILCYIDELKHCVLRNTEVHRFVIHTFVSLKVKQTLIIRITLVYNHCRFLVEIYVNVTLRVAKKDSPLLVLKEKIALRQVPLIYC